MTTAAFGKRGTKLAGSALLVVAVATLVLLVPLGCARSEGDASAKAAPGTPPGQAPRGDTAVRVRKTVAKVMERNIADVRDDASFVRDLDGDDLDRAELVLAIEQEFSIDMPDEDLERVWRSTVKDLISYVSRKVEQRR